MALSNKTKSSILDLLFGAAKVAVKASSKSSDRPDNEEAAPVAPTNTKPKAPAQNQNLAGCCDKKKVK